MTKLKFRNMPLSSGMEYCNYIPHEICHAFNGNFYPCTNCKNKFLNKETNKINEEALLMAIAEMKI
jgi:hypothetical protein